MSILSGRGPKVGTKMQAMKCKAVEIQMYMGILLYYNMDKKLLQLCIPRQKRKKKHNTEHREINRY